MTKYCTLIVSFLFFSTLVCAQSNTSEKEEDVFKRVFTPSIQVGYMQHLSDMLTGGVVFQTSLEYREKEGIFYRINYDDFDANFTLDRPQAFTNVLEGKVSFSELIGGVGYRKGSIKHRTFLLVQAGYRFYNFPIVSTDGGKLNVELENKSIFTSRLTAGYEYYLNRKSALSLELIYGQVWQDIDFWVNQKGLIGLTIGFSTSLM